MYADFDSALPLPTQMLVNLSEIMRAYFPYILVGLIILVFVLRAYKQTPAGKYQIDHIKLRLPVFGMLIKKVCLARFASTFAELIRAGVPIVRSLDIVAAATDNAVLSKGVLDAQPKIEAGSNISESIAACPEFPSLLLQMMGAGEKSGKMDDMLGRIAAIYKEEVDATVDGLTSLIEPLLIAFLGVTVGGIVIAMFLPIFKLSEIVM
jgi:type IV pilus assembly protein PilC